MSKNKTGLLIFLLLLTLSLSACSLLKEKNYTVQGSIKDGEGKGMANVTLTFTGGFSGITQTDENGNWSMTGLNGIVTITPHKDSGIFTPNSIDVKGKKTDVNFTGTYSTAKDIKGVIAQFLKSFKDEDVESNLACLSDQYFVNAGITREKFRDELIIDFEELNYSSFTIDYDMINSTFGLTYAVVGGKITVDLTTYWGETQHNEAYCLFDLEKTESGWLITNLYDYSPQKQEMKQAMETFLQALKEKDQNTLDSLFHSSVKISNEYIQFQSWVKNLTILNYEIIKERFIRYDDSNWGVIDLNMTYSQYASTFTEPVQLQFDFYQADGEWLIGIFIWDAEHCKYRIYGDTDDVEQINPIMETNRRSRNQIILGKN